MRPFPEEAFRRRIAPIAQWHFAPTPGAAMNLFDEGIAHTRVHVVGNTVIDELRLALDSPPDESADIPAAASRTITLTLHRRENYGRGLDLVCGAVLEAIESHTNSTSSVPCTRTQPLAFAFDACSAGILAFD